MAWTDEGDLAILAVEDEFWKGKALGLLKSLIKALTSTSTTSNSNVQRVPPRLTSILGVMISVAVIGTAIP